MPIERSGDMQFVAYALARCGELTEPGKPSLPPSWLGVDSWKAAYALFFDALGDGREPVSFANSLKNARDAFDAHVDSGRVGWVDQSAGGQAYRQDNMVRRVLNEWRSRSDDEIRDAVLGILDASGGRTSRLPAATLRLVSPEMIDAAIDAYQAGVKHNFAESRDYDVLLPSGERLPPKAVFGIALGPIIGRPAKPSDFTAGWGEPCFEIIEEAGYPIVEKAASSSSSDEDDERTWAEGSPKRTQHIRRERASGLAKMKKRRFIQLHGHLYCERCKIIPSEELGPHGNACIEVHHSTLAVAKMGGDSATRLADLQCLCANCHRIVHREQL